MAIQGEDGTLPDVSPADSGDRRLPRRVATPSSPVSLNELTRYERTALGLAALRAPDLVEALVLWTLRALEDFDGGADPDPVMEEAVGQFFEGWCGVCFKRVAYDRRRVAFEWPPEAHSCEFRLIAPSSWGKE